MTIFARVFVCLMLCAGLAACGPKEPTNLYMLSALAQPVSNEKPATRPIFGVGPVTAPAYLDRPQIVTRSSPNKLAVGEFDRWAEPFEALLARVLSENLSVLLNSDAVFTLPRRRLSEVDVQVELEIFRFDADPDGTVHLAGRWAVYTNGGKSLEAARKSSIRERIQGSGYEAVAIAMSRALETLSREIVQVLQPG